jgi:demethylmacrocin O-methyltransferase
MEQALKTFLRGVLGPAQILALRRAQVWVRSLLNSGDLKKLAILNSTDKWGRHWYCMHYEKLFAPIRKQRLKILEIGVGGYSNVRRGGASLRMWKHYFPNSLIYALDIHDKKALEERRIKIFQGDQSDTKFLSDTFAPLAPLDVIIDDGSHQSAHVIASFTALFPLLADGGIYAVEDTCTSYWPEFGGDSADLDRKDTLMNFFKSLTDGLNYQEINRPAYVPSSLDRTINSIHFYHNLIFVFKGANDEQSIMLP